MSRNKFPHDENNRIQKLYYDVNINTIFNRTKLQNIKTKFCKYENYINKKYYNDIQPNLLAFGCIRDTAYRQWQHAKRISLLHNHIHESHKNEKALFPIFRRTDEEYDEMKREDYFYNQAMSDIQYKIYEINNQQKKVRKYYKKCAHCEKMNMLTISGCKSKHKLCSECIYDKTECPVCNEDLGLLHCDICYEYKKELVDTGCKNKHQTCKDCLPKIIQQNKKRRGLDYTIRNGYHRDSEPYYFKYKCPFCRDTINIECNRDEYYNNYDYDDNDYADDESDEEFWGRDEENDVPRGELI